MTRKLFGTDGIRGTANAEPMTASAMLRVAMAAGRQFTQGDRRHLVVIGKDTRLSGYMLEPALTAGFIAIGMDVVLSGPIPTPGIAMLTRSLRADLGVMISASHNPYQDNGIKLFGPDGYKLSDEVEGAIEARSERIAEVDLAAPNRLGRAQRLNDVEGRYIEFVKGTFPKGLRLDGLKIVIDCANGAAYRVAPKVLWELGAEVVPIGVEPDGLNINRDCGTAGPEAMRAAVLANGADLGVALDGDADRVIMADHEGRLLDGDRLLAIVARSWRAADRIKGGGVVATVMSNLALERFLEGLGLSLERTRVGDRYVIERMREGGFNVGGEQSGHLVLSDYVTTGDGLMAALQALAVVVESGKPLAEAGRCFEPLPQRMENVACDSAAPLDDRRVRAAIKAAERRLGGHGRILVRRSGTEPVVRVMAEGEDERAVAVAVESVVEAIGQAVGRAS